MSGFYEPDLTGTNPDYRVTNKYYQLYKTGQIIEFDEPVYLTSIEVRNALDPSILYAFNTGWNINAEDIDETTTAKIKATDITFDKDIVKRIRIIMAVGTPINVELRYQKVYAATSKSAIQDDSSVLFTPAAYIDVCDRIASLELFAQAIGESTASTTAVPRFLELDINKENPDNVVESELYIVNTTANKNIIKPAQGSFFKDGVALVAVDSGNLPLVLNVDYKIVGMNTKKTKLSTNTSGIFDYIQVIRPYSGTISMEYHAVGGEPTTGDIDAVWKNVQDLKSFIDDNTFLTNETLRSAKIIETFSKRLTELEEALRALTNGSPAYIDSTNGITVVKRIQAVDANLHWWTIARLYQIDGSPDIIRTDRMHFRFRQVNAAVTADVFAAVDVNLTRDQLRLSTAGIIQDVKFDLYGTSDPTPVSMPQFRIIWDADATNPTTGVILQIGLSLPTLNETIAIEDLSGAQSGWILDATTGTIGSPITPNDNNITLPDNSTIWTYNANQSGPSKWVRHMMPNNSGYLMWTGSKGVNDIDTGSSVWAINSHLIPNWFWVSDVHTVQIELSNTVNNETRRVLVPMTGLTNNNRFGEAVINIAGTLCSFKVNLTLNMTTGEVGATAQITNANMTTSDWAVRYIILKV